MARSKQQPVGRAVHNSNVSGMQAGHNRLHKQRAIDEGANKPKSTKTQEPTIKHLKKKLENILHRGIKKTKISCSRSTRGSTKPLIYLDTQIKEKERKTQNKLVIQKINVIFFKIERDKIRRT